MGGQKAIVKACDQVGMGDVHAVAGEAEMNCVCVGSGILLAAYDSCSKVGGCGHFILPAAPLAFDKKRPGKYINTGVSELVRQMTELGADRKNIRVALAGGSSLFMHSEQAESSDLGARNAHAVEAELAKEGIECVAQDLGGHIGRSITFSIANGMVRIRKGIQTDRVLCRF